MTKSVKRGALLAVLFVGLIGCGGAEPKQTASTGGAKQIAGEKTPEEPTPPVEAALTAGDDVLPAVLAANAHVPGANWRAGHVSPREFDPKQVERRGDGFQIQFPSGAPIPTPTVYKDKLLISGGFRSKQFFCADAKTGEMKWAVDLDDDGPSSAVVEDDVVVFNTESCTIFALDVNTGEQLWSWWLGDPLMSTPTIANGRVFTSYPTGSGGGGMQQAVQSNMIPEGPLVSPPPQVPVPQPVPEPASAGEPKDKTAPMPCTHALAAFDLKTGKVLWQKWIDSDVMSAPVAVDGELYVATFSGTLYKFDQKTGEIKSARRDRATSAPVIAGSEVLYTQRSDDPNSDVTEEAIASQDRTTGKKQRVFARKKARYLDSKVQSESEYSVQSKADDAANGFAGGAPSSANAQAAFHNIGQASVSSLQAFQGSRIYHAGGKSYNTMGDEIVCTESKSGKTLWKKKLIGDLDKEGGSIGTSPAAAGDYLFVATLDGEVLQLNPKSGDAVKAFKVGAPVRAQPAIVDGRIYVGTQDGKVIAIDTGDPRLTGWTTWGKDARHSGVGE